MPNRKPDFEGWATKNDIKCTDGVIIRKDAFKHNDGIIVPMVWNHYHNDPENVLGKVLLHNRNEGVWASGFFNNTPKASHAKELVEHGDITSLSIYANKVQKNGENVIHGDIKEVSLVLAGANEGAKITSVVLHGDGTEADEEIIINLGGNQFSIEHAETKEDTNIKDTNEQETKNDNENKTVKDVLDTLNEEQAKVVYGIIGSLVKDEDDSDDEDIEQSDDGGYVMKHNAFEGDNKMKEQNTLTHSEMETIVNDAKRLGSLKESVLAHAQDYGIENIDYLFPDARAVTNKPEFIKRDTTWVSKVMSGVHKSPFSRIKSVFADITEDEARAKGYIKGNLKKDEVFTLLKRTTSPTTIYKKQKIDRDDVIDITDFDVVAWIKSEMRLMLDEEIARAILIGDGRISSSDDKIKEDCVRPIFNDHDLYTVQTQVNVASGATEADKAKEFITAAIRSRKHYKGSGSPTLFTTEDMITECLLLTDEMGRDLYDSVEKLATKLRVKEIVPVEVMEGAKAKNGTDPLVGILVNLNDYNVGADKGGAINMFDDFDINYNQMLYLIETRISGALIKPYSAIAYSMHTAE